MRNDPHKDDNLLELVGDLCNFIIDQIVHVRGLYHDRSSNLGRNPQYQHLCEWERLGLGHWLDLWMECDIGNVIGLVEWSDLWNVRTCELCECNDELHMFLWIGLVILKDIMFLWIIYVYVCIFLWIGSSYNFLVNYICIYVLVRFEFSNLNFFVGKWTAGAVLELTTPTNGICRDGQWIAPRNHWFVATVL